MPPWVVAERGAAAVAAVPCRASLHLVGVEVALPLHPVGVEVVVAFRIAVPVAVLELVVSSAAAGHCWNLVVPAWEHQPAVVPVGAQPWRTSR